MGFDSSDEASVAELLCFAADGLGVGSNDPAEAILCSVALDAELMLAYVEGLAARPDTDGRLDSTLLAVLNRIWHSTRAGIALHRKQRKALLAAARGRQ
jgi:hypothetical protein